MTQQPQQMLRSVGSDRAVVPGWTNIVPGVKDAIELQLDLQESDMKREQALLLIEFWATPENLTLQSLLPVRAFVGEPKGWCVFLPAQGRVFIRAIDPQPSPPLLAAHGINLDPQTPVGTTVHVKVEFPKAAPGSN
ncbi:uracil-DNA glycosylase [Deinococcus sonorensis]|uniref:Uracil-DNA glycosylase n=2 Tax=Deinococcus sonorensis TaxID=309891 RepID=A0AAU7UE20_9DEIO